ncbi:MAG: ABC transporter permease subunit [Bacteroidota bacterium]
MLSLFNLRGDLSRSQGLVLGIAGLVIFFVLWWIIAELNSEMKAILPEFETRLESGIGKDSLEHQKYLDSLAVVDSIMISQATEFEKIYPSIPSPIETFKSYPSLIRDDDLFKNTWQSIWLNLKGYFWAIFISVPFGFLLGLFPFFRGLFSKQVDALRYLPLTALVGMFMTWFGTNDGMKVAFLAFGIIVYLLPVVVQRINEVNNVYLKTVFTLGATDWQTIKSVYIPSVMSRLMDDIRVLTAISWTYIIIAELLNKKGGLGALIHTYGRFGFAEKVFAILIVFIIIGFLQDRIFVFIDKRLFPHKYVNTRPSGLNESQLGILVVLGGVLTTILLQSLLPYADWITSYLLPILATSGILFILFGEFKIYQNKQVNA